MKKQDKLRVDWSKKEKDIEFHWPLCIHTSTDGRYLYNLFGEEFMKQMKDRGYDITTVKFEISPLLPNNELFPTLTDQYHGK